MLDKMGMKTARVFDHLLGFAPLAVRWALPGIGFLILAGTIIYMWLMRDFQSHWIDELFSARVSNPDLPFAAFWHEIVTDVHPPLYQLLLRIWYSIFGWSSGSGRALSVVLFAASAIPFYLTLRLRLDKSAGLLGTALFMLSWPMMYYGLEVRSYILVAFLVTWSLYLTGRLFHRGSISYMTIAGLFIVFILGLYTHYFFALFVVGIGVFAFVRLILEPQAIDRYRLGILFAAALIAVLTLLPWALVMSSQAGGGSWMSRPNDTSLWLFATRLFGGVIPAAVIIGLAIGGSLAPSKPLGHRDSFLFFVVFCAVFTPVVAYLLSLVAMPVLTHRNLIVCAPAVMLLVSFALNRFDALSARVLGHVFILVLLVSVPIEFDLFTAQKKQDWRAVAKYVGFNADNQTVYTNRIGDLGVYVEWGGYRNEVQRLGDMRKAEEPFWVAIGHTNVNLPGEYCVLEEQRFREVYAAKLHPAAQGEKCQLFTGKVR